MSDRMHRAIQKFSDLRVLVIGDVMLDSYLHGVPGRLCREAPVPVVDLASRTDVPGGAGNTAVNLKGLGAQVRLMSAIGADRKGQQLRRHLEDLQVGTEHLQAVEGRRTFTRNRVFASSQMLLRFDDGSVENLPAGAQSSLARSLPSVFQWADAVIVADHDGGVVSDQLIEVLRGLQARAPRIIAVDSRRRLPAFRNAGITVTKQNYDEAAELLKLEKSVEDDARSEVIFALADTLLERVGAQMAAVTMGSSGAVLCENGSQPYRTYGVASAPSYSAGAGDTFLAVLVLALAAGAETPLAAELASAASAVAVSKSGTGICSQQELLGQVSFDGKYVRDLSRLVLRLDFYRRQGRKIVFTNGCFDILHPGHITYLNRAKASGDVLVVGVNSDSSVRKLKGPERPINNLDDRVQVLGALSCVDHIVAFDGETASDVIRVIRPDIYIKGGDYTRERLPEAPIVESLGGEVRILPFLENRSTTNIIERIREAGDGTDRQQLVS